MDLDAFKLSAIELIVTTACPLKCPYCYVVQLPDFRPKTVPAEILLRRLDQLYDAGHLDGVVLTVIGGEPLIHPQIGEIVKRCMELHEKCAGRLKVNLITSGRYPKAREETIHGLMQYPAFEWLFSYHGERNQWDFSRMVGKLIASTTWDRRLIRTNIVINNLEDALAMFRGIREAILALDVAKDRFPPDRAAAIEEKINRLMADPEQNRSGFTLDLSDRSALIVGLTKAIDIGENTACFEARAKKFACPLLMQPSYTCIVVDEDGLVKPCVTPLQRVAHPVFDHSVDTMKAIPGRAVLYERLVAIQTNLCQAAMLAKEFDPLDADRSLKRIFGSTRICEICAAMD
ncbi:MAG: radical SAM protein [Planctomycetota bacterium]|jgi:organic radical activating enzyme